MVKRIPEWAIAQRKLSFDIHGQRLVGPAMPALAKRPYLECDTIGTQCARRQMRVHIVALLCQ